MSVRPALRGSLLQSVSLSALLVAGAADQAHAGSFKSLGQALASHASAAVAAATTANGITAATAAGLGSQNLAKAASHFRSLSEALSATTAYSGAPVADGLAPTGLNPITGVSTGGTNTAQWSGAGAPTQTVSNGTTNVTVTQTSSVAYLTWKNFSVGAKTDLIFNQSAGGTLASSWIAINAIPAGDNPSTILGEINAPGKVYILNANGILFGAGAQVNLGALIASTDSIAAAQLTTTNGLVTGVSIYGSQATTTTFAPSFQCSVTATCGNVTVQAGAEITTPAPTGSNGGGYVMLLGSAVENDGIISTPHGQTVLAAGNNIFVEPGYSTSNTLATVIGSQIATSNNSSVTATGTTALGAVTNTGIIMADQGDITMAGHLVTQAGIIIATTTVDNRGTVHLLTPTNDATASVVLAPNSVTEILPEDDGETALDSQRATDLSESAAYNAARGTPIGPILNDYNRLSDEIGESRIEISTGGTVTMAAGALALAQGGQVAVGGSTILLQSGATIDVSGTNASLPVSMDTLNVSPIVAYYLRDSAANRTGGLEFNNVYIDERTLVEIGGSSAYAGNIYTQGGLLEVSGLLGLVPHGINEFSSIGGQVQLQATSGSGTTATGGTVIIAQGATINLTGGTVTYGAGEVPQSYVQAADGQIYNINDAPGDLVYTGIYTGQVENHTRWHVTETFNNPLLTPSEIYEPAYTIGRDAGTLTITAANGAIDGTIDAGVSVGSNQTSVRPTTITDPFLLAQTVAPLGGDLLVGDYTGGIFGNPFAGGIILGNTGNNGTLPVVNVLPDSVTGSVSVGSTLTGTTTTGSTLTNGGSITVLPLPPGSVVAVDTAALNADGLAEVTFSTAGTIDVTAPVSIANGGAITLSASDINVESSITAHGGKISLTNLYPGVVTAINSSSPGTITLAAGAVLDASGLWTNLALDPGNVTLAGFANAGNVDIIGTGGVDLASGSLIDVASGGVLSATGKLTAASGGSVTVSADILPGSFSTLDTTGGITYAATILGYGSGGAGTLSLSAPNVVVGPAPSAAGSTTLVVGQSLFDSGFADYAITGDLGLTVEPGVQIDVTRPVYVLANPDIATGAPSAGAYDVILPAVYTQVKGGDSFTQRAGASVTLAASVEPGLFNGGGGPVTIGAGAHITVDPKQSILVDGYGQVTDYGTLTAHGGTITVGNTRFETPANGAIQTANYVDGLSVWIADGAVIDASGQAAVFTDALGRSYGQAQAGGSIYLGGLGGLSSAGTQSTYAQVIVQPGALLDAAGASATVDVSPGLDQETVANAGHAVTLAGNGGLIAARSYEGIAFDGTLLAGGAGPGAAGGTLSMKIDVQTLGLLTGIPQSDIAPSQVIISQNFIPVQTEAGLAPGDATDPSTVGLGRISQQQLTAGGFDTLDIFTQDDIAFAGNVSLQLGRSLILESGAVGETTAHSNVSITAPYVEFIGFSAEANNGIDLYDPGSHVVGPGLTTSTLTVNAGLIDFVNSTNLGGVKLLAQIQDSQGNQAYPPVYTFAIVQGFAQSTFNSSGDIRFEGDAGGAVGKLASSGNITFRAAQLYPTSSGVLPTYAEVLAGYDPFISGTLTSQVAGGTITVLGLGGATPQLPYSVGGTLGLFADTVVQDGIVRAPEGTLLIGEPETSSSASLQLTTNVTFGPNSITSVSLDGLTVPYGGTVDGVNYLYDGVAVAPLNPVIQISSVNVNVQSGATLDISGGGTLAGAGFIAGRGGSTNVNTTPLLNSGSGTVAANTTDQIYAIVPGYNADYAPQSPVDSGYDTPSVGERVSISAGEVAGLAAGTYTLLPAYYDLLPGAFRVELTGQTLLPAESISFGNFTTIAAVTLSTAQTGIASSLPTEALITPASGVLQLSQFDQESYSAFEINNAATFDQPRPQLPQDGKTLIISFSEAPAVTTTLTTAGSTTVTTTQPIGTLSIAPGTVQQALGVGGYGATLDVVSKGALELLAPDAATVQLPSLSGNGTQLTTGIDASQLSALDIPRIVIGGTLTSNTALPNEIIVNGISPQVVAEPGSDLSAGDIILVATSTGAVTVSSGATLSTIGQPDTATGLAQGFYFFSGSPANGGSPVLAVSNAQVVYLNGPAANGASITVDAGAVIQGGGSLDFVAPAGTSVQVGAATLAATYLDLDVADISIGSAADLATFANLLPAGLTLTDATLNALAANSQQLILTAQQAVNIIGNVSLSSATTDLVLNTPAIYGYGTAAGTVTVTSSAGSAAITGVAVGASIESGVASITAPNLTWSGIETTLVTGSGEVTTNVSATPGGRVAGFGAATGSTSTVDTSTGTTTTLISAEALTPATSLTIDATKTLTLGYGPDVQVDDQTSLARVVVGYGNVALQAGTEITAGAQSSLGVYASQATINQAGTGGNLTLETPLITAASGAVLDINAGGTFTALSGPISSSGTPASAATVGSISTLGATIDITADAVKTATAFALPAGVLSITSQGNIDLASGTDIDLSGRITTIFDQSPPSNGGTLALQAYAGPSGTAAGAGGSITEDAGATINVSSPGADAGNVTALASNGTVAFNGSLSGTAAGSNSGGSFTVFAYTLGTPSSGGTQTGFDALNATLNQGGFNASRTVELASGDITVDQTVVAHNVSLAADAGNIDVTGTINASGTGPGSITLSAADTLTLGGTAVLDAHATATARDSYGEDIDSENRALVTLTSASGTVVLDSGASIDVSYPDAANNPQGQVVINAPRVTGAGGLVDVAVEATGTVNITGAKSIDLYAFTTYTPNSGNSNNANVNGTVVQNNGLSDTTAGNAVTASGTIGLDQINADSAAFISSVNADASSLASQLAGLVHYASTFNVLPGVIIQSTASGNLTITGDLDFSGFRYSDPSGLFGISSANTVLGSGEPGSVVFRSANDLIVNGSVSDGFTLPPDATSGTLVQGDTNGWEFLTSAGSGGFQTTNQDVLLPQGAVAIYTPKGSSTSETSSAIYLIGSANSSAATAFDTTRPISLNYAITIEPADLQASTVIPFPFIVGAASSAIPAGGFIATSTIVIPPAKAGGASLTYLAGQLVPGGLVLPEGTTIAAGAVLPISVVAGIQGKFEGTTYTGQVVPAGTPFQVFADPDIYLAKDIELAPNDLIPAETQVFFGATFGSSTTVQTVTEVAYRAPSLQAVGTGATPVEGYLYALAQMLPAGDQSWNMAYVSGANLGAASTAAVQPSSTLYGGVFTATPDVTNEAPGSLLIADQHDLNPAANSGNVLPAFSVIRTGTGNLSLISGGDIDQTSLYGIYTAGTQDPLGGGEDAQFNSPRANEGSHGNLLPGNTSVSELIASTYQAYYPTDGGNFLLAAAGNVTSDTVAPSQTTNGVLLPSDLITNWLWRQGSTQLGQPTAWWINFGTLLVPLSATGSPDGNVSLAGFTGFGALGGGNVTVTIGGNAGQQTDRDEGNGSASNASGEGLVVAVGGTGRLLPGSSVPITTGGGSLDVTIGGVLNPLDALDYKTGDHGSSINDVSTQDPSVNGDLIDIRGNIDVTAGAIGRIDYLYNVGNSNENDPRSLDPFTPNDGIPNGGIEVAPGDGSVSITTDRDLVLGGAADPGRIDDESLTSLQAYTTLLAGYSVGGGYTGFSLWQPTTSISLFSAGGNVTPTTLPNQQQGGNGAPSNTLPTDYREIYPSTLLVTAATGDIVYGQDGAPPSVGGYSSYSLETMPSANGNVSFLAGGSIYANGYTIDLSGANPAGLSLPTDPAFSSAPGQQTTALTNVRVGDGTYQSPLALFAFEPDTPATNVHENDTTPARFYAAGGDIVNFQTGETLYFIDSNEPLSEWYIAAKPVWIIASNDIVSSGTRPNIYPNATIFGTQENQYEESVQTISGTSVNYYSSGNLFLNNTAQSVSLIQAGRDILSTYAYVGGPGLLDVTAGRNIYQASYAVGSTQVLSFGSIKSLGDNLITGSALNSSAGAGIDVLAGVGAAGPDYTAFADLYFNPANQANLALPITDASNKGKVQQVYTSELVAWLAANYGYSGTAAGALAAFQALPAIEQGIFVREVFFDELAASAAQETNPSSRFYKSYDRGRLAIDTLFPSSGHEAVAGAPVGYTGSITAYSGTINGITTASGTAATFDGGFATLFGGTIQILDPGGATTFGITGGPAPGNSSGIVTYGSGDIDVYALGSVELGQSRIFTTGGGNIEIWSSSGDINAGIGAKTTVVFNPPELLYDNQGDVTETPPATTSGAGIATLQPLPDVPAGDVILVAPAGTIDPGEAGVRVAGNATLAARVVVTTNLSVGGKTAGAPTVAVASLGAVEAAGAATGAAANAAETQGQRNNNDSDAASIVDVEVISIGGSYDEEQKRRKRGL